MADYKQYKCEGCGYTVNANPKEIAVGTGT